MCPAIAGASIDRVVAIRTRPIRIQIEGQRCPKICDESRAKDGAIPF
jgi:hypothetical protein